MSISEKTLELNITHELLTLADSLWMLIFNQNSRSSSVNYPRRMRSQMPVALGLSLQEEKKQGWDVKINFPSDDFINRAVFIQYKKPYFRSYSKHIDSIYHGAKSDRHPHYLFGINNNTPRDQHIKLQALARNNNVSNSVIYALPRILNDRELQHWSGVLTNLTTFLTIKELDDMASIQGVTINTGDKHEIRMLSSGELLELHSEPNVLELKDDTSRQFLSDTIAWRMHKFIHFFSSAPDDEVVIEDVINLQKFKDCYHELALYFPISPDNFPGVIFNDTDSMFIQKNYDKFIKEYRGFFNDKGLEKLLDNLGNRFLETYKKVKAYEDHLSNAVYFNDINISFKSRYLANADGDHELRLKFDTETNFKNITYSVF